MESPWLENRSTFSTGYLTATWDDYFSCSSRKQTMTKEFRKGKRNQRMEEKLARRQRAFRLTAWEKAKVAGLLLFGTPVVVTIVAYLWKIAFHVVLG
jgi:hypothetical protein